jgi:hypothetical protein
VHPAAAYASSVQTTDRGADGATPSPAGPFTGTTNAAGEFTFTVNSPTGGTDTCHAAATLSVGGSASFTVETKGGGAELR